jgi:hypothetical protein
MMGYGRTDIAVFGVVLHDEEVEALRQELLRVSGADPEKAHLIREFLRTLVPDEDLKTIPKKTSDGLRPQYRGAIERVGIGDRKVHDVQVWSHGTDSRVHSLVFDTRVVRQHSFGIYCGSHGYGWFDKMSQIMREGAQKQAQRNFEKYCKPILEKLGLEINPCLHKVTQVW